MVALVPRFRGGFGAARRARGNSAALGRAAALAALATAGAPPARGQPVRPQARGGLRLRPTAADSSATAAIRAMLDRSAAAWNRGDLDGFMDSYAPGEGTTFVGRRGIVRGPDQIRAGYAPRFAPGYARGTLHFENLEVDLLAPDAANAIATYVLTTRTAAGADSTIARGPTSLVVRRLGTGWKIVHDHSS